MISVYHAKYFAYELTRRRPGGDEDRIAQSLFDSSVDLNPHQIDAALFALQNPLNKGVILADEVGLGKTIEAALLVSQYWSERKRRIVVVCPAALRKQWANELAEKFNLPTQVIDGRTYNQLKKQGIYNPLDVDKISILSYNFVSSAEPIFKPIPWDLVVIDEAHKLRNAHRESHQTGQAIKRAFAGSKKLLLTATPLQNNLMELYGLSTIIDEYLFGDAVSFRSQFMRDGTDIPALKHRLKEFTKRTLRQDVLEYVKYTQRLPITIPFTPSDDEVRLYDLISAILPREQSFALPARQKHLVSLIVRKLLASSTQAVIKTLETMLARLKELEEKALSNEDWISFRDKAEILIATEAAAEGVNLQFCNLVVNYDLPWNPQRVEQRIGRCHLYRLSHPLGEYVLDQGRRLATAPAKLSFDLSGYPYKLSALDAFKGQSGWLCLTQLALDSFQLEEHLIFTAQADNGPLLDQEACEALFKLVASETFDEVGAPSEAFNHLVTHQVQAKLNQALEQNQTYFKQAREKLEAWAEDQMKSAEQTLEDTKLKLRDAKRQSRQAETIEQQKHWQEQIKKLEKQQRRQRQSIFDVEDEIEAKRDELIDALEKQMHKTSSTHHLFTVRWTIT